MPGFSLFGKLRFMLLQAFRANIDQMIIQENKDSDVLIDVAKVCMEWIERQQLKDNK